MISPTRGKLPWRRATLVVAVLHLMTACAADGRSGAGVADQADVTRAEARLATWLDGTDGKVPSDGPPAQKDKSIWVVTCGQAAAGCATPGGAVVEAAEAIGWEATLCDGKLAPPTYAECVTSATAARPDAIVLVTVDCQFVQGPLQSAREVGISIYALNSFDCDTSDGEKHFDAELGYHGFENHKEFLERSLGPAIGSYIIAETDGEARTLLVRENDALSAKALTDGVETTLESCSGCETYTVEVTLEDIVTGKLATKVSTALTRYPDVTAVSAPYDAAILLGIGQAVSAAGRPLILTGSEGLAANIDLIEKGEQSMAAGLSAGWSGWAAVDGLNRLFAGEPQVDSGIGNQVILKDRNVPDDTAYYDSNIDENGKPRQDYKAIYLKSWGR